VKKRHRLLINPQGKSVTPSVYKTIMSQGLLTNPAINTQALIKRACVEPRLTLMDLILRSKQDSDYGFRYDIFATGSKVVDPKKIEAVRAVLKAAGFAFVTMKSSYTLYKGTYNSMVVPSMYYLVNQPYIERYKAAYMFIMEEWSRYEGKMAQREKRRIEKVKQYHANKKLRESTIFNPEKQTLEEYHSMTVTDFI